MCFHLLSWDNWTKQRFLLSKAQSYKYTFKFLSSRWTSAMWTLKIKINWMSRAECRMSMAGALASPQLEVVGLLSHSAGSHVLRPGLKAAPHGWIHWKPLAAYSTPSVKSVVKCSPCHEGPDENKHTHISYCYVDVIDNTYGAFIPPSTHTHTLVLPFCNEDSAWFLTEP